MITIKTFNAIPGVCLEACDEIVLPNKVGAMCVANLQAAYIRHDYNPPEKEWVPIPIPPPEPPKYEPSDPLAYPAGQRVAKIAVEAAEATAAAEKLNSKRKKAAHEEADQG